MQPRSKEELLLKRGLKRARLFEIQRSARRVKQLRGKKGNSKQLEKHNRKCLRNLEELNAIKKLDLDDIVGLIVNSHDVAVSLLSQKEPPIEVVQRAIWRLLKSKAMSQHVSHLSDNLSVCMDRAIFVEQDCNTIPSTKIMAGSGSTKGIVQCTSGNVMDGDSNGSIATDSEASITKENDVSANSDDDAFSVDATVRGKGDATGDKDGRVVDVSCGKQDTSEGERKPQKLSILTQEFSSTSDDSSSVESVEIDEQEQVVQSGLQKTAKFPSLTSTKLLKHVKTSASRTSARTLSQVVESEKLGKNPEMMMSSFFVGSLFAQKKALKKKPKNRPGQRARRQ